VNRGVSPSATGKWLAGSAVRPEPRIPRLANGAATTKATVVLLIDFHTNPAITDGTQGNLNRPCQLGSLTASWCLTRPSCSWRPLL